MGQKQIWAQASFSNAKTTYILCFVGARWRDLVDLGWRFHAHWILNGGPPIYRFHERSTGKEGKRCKGGCFEKNMKLR